MSDMKDSESYSLVQRASVATGAGSSLSVTRGGVQKKPQKLKSKVAAFALDSDDEG